MEPWLEFASSRFNLPLSSLQQERFQEYLILLLDWNTKINLTAIRTPEAIRLKHFLDSLSVTLGWQRQVPPESLIDLGTGAGFPGIPLKILWPELRLTLVDSVGKKINFCKLVMEKLELENYTALAARAEELGQNPDHREKYQLVTARALASMPVLLEYALPFAKPGGCVVLQKGADGLQEAERCQKIMRKLGGDLKEILPINLPEVEGQRYLVVIDKNAHTPVAFPRRTGVPAKMPLSD